MCPGQDVRTVFPTAFLKLPLFSQIPGNGNQSMTLGINGEKIRGLREGKGWSRGTFAGKCNLKYDTVQRAEELGRCRASTAKIMADVLGVLLDDLRPTVRAEPAAPVGPKQADAATEVLRHWDRRDSVNLVVARGADWRQVLRQLCDANGTEFGILDLENPLTATRAGVLAELLAILGQPVELPDRPHDLHEFGKRMKTVAFGLLAVSHFDIVAEPERRNEYGMDFFHTLRHYTTTDKKLG